MTRIKFCGLRTLEDVHAANEILPEYVGFVFARRSKRYVTPAQAAELRGALSRKIIAVGVFVNENPRAVAELLSAGTIDAAQLHGAEDDAYIKNLRGLVTAGTPIIQAFKTDKLTAAQGSPADFVLIDAGAGDGKTFDWRLVQNFKREYFLAGGLNPENVSAAIELLNPFAVDVSSGIESDGRKDFGKMRTFASSVREGFGRR